MENGESIETLDSVPTDEKEIANSISNSPLASALYNHFRKYRPELIEKLEGTKDSGDQISEAVS